MREGVKEAYISAKDRLDGVTLSQFDESLMCAIIHPVKVRGEVAGAIVQIGSEIHCCIMAQYCRRWVNKSTLHLINGIIDQYGEVTTKATTQQGIEFVERGGFTFSNGMYRKTKKWELNQL
jgi:hypothetical protein